jgi:glycine amidinotransferase
MPELIHLLPEPLRKWELIQVNVECRENYLTNLASVNIYANVLPIGPNNIIIFNETDKPDTTFTKVLEQRKINYTHVRLRHSRLFGGGAHCATLDLIRDEVLEDYFS